MRKVGRGHETAGWEVALKSGSNDVGLQVTRDDGSHRL